MAGDRAKSAWLAVILTVFIPGLGQAYAGRYDRGLVILAVTVFYCFFTRQPLPIMKAPLLAEGETLFSWARETLVRLGVNGLRLFACLFMAAVLYIWIVVDAYLSASQKGRKD